MKTVITNIYPVLSPVRGAALSALSALSAALSVQFDYNCKCSTKASLKDNGWRAMRVGRSAMLETDLGQEGFLE